MPKSPPVTERTTDSTKNWVRMTIFRAPRPADTDLSRALGHAHQHNVHDSHPGRQQGDRADDKGPVADDIRDFAKAAIKESFE